MPVLRGQQYQPQLHPEAISSTTTPNGIPNAQHCNCSAKPHGQLEFRKSNDIVHEQLNAKTITYEKLWCILVSVELIFAFFMWAGVKSENFRVRVKVNESDSFSPFE